jgi:CheY-like chemotaxis protein
VNTEIVEASVPIIAVTAQLAAEERKRALASGMNDCTEKPIRAVTLAAMLSRWIQRQETASSP